ncbi:hypothetical protein ACH42_04585 [Endozoicomonas sp. (ex Bugula neritina AB1)]|nr:hypothetical protein ACH42_04585 [Endozoicomonas sp. (ex Bugula neritina AB1)]
MIRDMIRRMSHLILISLFWLSASVFSSSVAYGNDLNTQLEIIRQQHFDALQLSLNYPDKGRLAHSRVASQLEAFIGEERIDQGVLAYNIGNSWFHGGRYGESILWYLRADRHGFDEPQLQHNLDFVRTKRLDNLPDLFGPIWLTTFYEWSGYGVWLVIGALVYLVFWWQLWRFIKLGSSERERLIVASFCLILMSVSLCFRYFYQPQMSDGVILANEVEARKGPGLVFAPAFTQPLNAGTEVALLQQQGTWMEVSLSDGQVAWLPETSLELVHF